MFFSLLLLYMLNINYRNSSCIKKFFLQLLDVHRGRHSVLLYHSSAGADFGKREKLEQKFAFIFIIFLMFFPNTRQTPCWCCSYWSGTLSGSRCWSRRPRLTTTATATAAVTTTVTDNNNIIQITIIIIISSSSSSNNNSTTTSRQPATTWTPFDPVSGRVSSSCPSSPSTGSSASSPWRRCPPRPLSWSLHCPTACTPSSSSTTTATSATM